MSSSSIVVSTNGLFVTMSYFISVLGAFTTFSFMLEMKHIRSKILKLIYLVFSSVAFGGCAVFSMHFVGSICFAMTMVDSVTKEKKSLSVNYHVGLTIASAIAAIVLCFCGLLITTIHLFLPMITKYLRCKSDSNTEQNNKEQRKGIEKVIPTKQAVLDSIFGNEMKPHFIQIAFGAFFCTAGIVVMHYLGMMSMEIQNAKAMYNPGVVIASIITGYIVSCVGLWLAMNMTNEYQQALSALVAALAICGTHYIGMVSATYKPVLTDKTFSRKGTLSNYEITLVVTLATTITCFFMLMVSSISNRKRLLLIAKTTLELDDEKKKVEVSQTSVDKLSSLIKKVSFEEHQTRRVLNLVSDGVCIINKEGQILKWNTTFEKICSLNSQSLNLSHYLPLDLNEIFQSKTNKFNVTLENKIRGSVDVEISSSVEECDTTFCILVLNSVSLLPDIQRNRQNTNLRPDPENLLLPKNKQAALLEKTLDNDEALSEFRSFCKKEMCDENMEFVLSVREYKRGGDILKRVEQQMLIVNTYLKKGSPKQLNLPESVLLQATIEISAGYGQPDLFDALEVRAKEILHDSHFRFLKQIPREMKKDKETYDT